MRVLDSKQIVDCDVLDWMRERIEEDRVNYTVQTSNGDSYGVINYRKM